MTFGKNDDPPEVGLLYKGGSWVYLVAFVFIGPIILTNLLVRKHVDIKSCRLTPISFFLHSFLCKVLTLMEC